MMEEHPDCTHILDLTDDLLLHLLDTSHLSPIDLCNLAKACKRFQSILSQEVSHTWKTQCQTWLSHSKHEEWLPEADAGNIKDSLEVQGYRALCKNLIRFGDVSPVGHWWLTGSMYDPLRSVVKGLLAVGLNPRKDTTTDKTGCLTTSQGYLLTGQAADWKQMQQSDHYSFKSERLFTIPMDRTATPRTPHGIPVLPGPELTDRLFEMFQTDIDMRIPIKPDPSLANRTPTSATTDEDAGAVMKASERDRLDIPPAGEADMNAINAAPGRSSTEEYASARSNSDVHPSKEGYENPNPSSESGSDQGVSMGQVTASHSQHEASLACGAAQVSEQDVSMAAVGDAATSSDLTTPLLRDDVSSSGALPRSCSPGMKRKERHESQQESDDPSFGKLKMDTYLATSRDPIDSKKHMMTFKVVFTWRPSQHYIARQDGRTARLAASGVFTTFDLLSGIFRKSFGSKPSASSGNADSQVHTKTYEFRFQRASSLPPTMGQLPIASPPAQLANHTAVWQGLNGLQGLWTAEYGGHGPEAVQVGVVASPPPDTLQRSADTWSGPRWEGFKLVGDVNVPSGRHTFMADLTRCKIGRYDGRDVLNDEDDPRPVLAFVGSHMALVDLSDRPVQARFAALGQINERPGTWNPSWENAEIILYEGADGATEKVFSVLWRDRGTLHLQIMDFFPFPLKMNPTWAASE